MLYSCSLCGKEYRSSKAHAQHLKSRSHIARTSQGTNNQEEEKVIIKPLPRRDLNKHAPRRVGNKEEIEESEEDEWEEVDPEEETVGEAANALTNMNIGGPTADGEMDEDDEEFEEFDPSCCFMCDVKHDTIESCMIHMHKYHGFFIPDVEYLKDPKGLLTYLGLKVLVYTICSFFFLPLSFFS